MKINKQYLVFMLVFLFLLLGTTISYGTYSASSSTVESEGKITVNVTSSEALDAYNLDLQSYEGLTFNNCSKTENGAIININGSSIGYMNTSGTTTDLGTYSFTAPKVTEEKTYTITFLVDKKTTVTSKITVTPVTTNEGSSTGTGTTTNTGTNTGTSSSTTNTDKKSSEARLDTFGITPNDFSGFSKNKNKEDWSVTVPNDVTKVNVYATPLDKNAKVEGTGDVTLKEGDNTVKVTVTAEAGNTKTYTLTIKRKTVAEENAENGECRLKTLGIKPKEYDFTGFDSEKTEYSVEVPNEVDEIEVYATAMNSSAQITGTGMIELDEGVNELEIEVIAANGTKKIYTLEVTRKKAEEKKEFGLSTLSIDGLKLTPSFKVGTYEYTVELTEDLSSLEIQAKANDEDATVEIVGNEDLQEGENVITILVTNKETEEVATYQIIVNKNLLAEEIEQTSWLKPSTWGKEEIIKIVIIIVLIILIICAIILKINIGKEKENNRKIGLPGAEELDKAMAEHQELSEEPNYIESTEEVQKNEAEQNYIEEIAKNRFSVMEDGLEEKTKRKGRHF